MKRITLPDGGWVDVREKKDVRVRDRRLVQSASIAAVAAMQKLDGVEFDKETGQPVNEADLPNLTFDEAQSLARFGEASIVAMIGAWSREEPLPDFETVGDMDPDLFDFLSQSVKAIAVEVAKEGAVAAGAGTFDPTPHDEPGVPTGSSSG